jgi:GTP-dependent phosphoenolpyruvate carboxykinase
LNELEGVSDEQMETLLAINPEEWRMELVGHANFFKSLGGVVPDELLQQRTKLAERLS